MTNNSWFPKILLGVYLLVFIFLAISPFSREVWFDENLPIVLIVLYLIFLYWRGVQFSNTSYALMSVLIFLHTVGGHFTFERVPFDWFNDFFGFERNMYDRVAHFSVGFYAYPIAEYLSVRKLANTKWLVYLTPLFFIISVAAIYEIFEWWYAVTKGGEAGVAFLGSQGDIWDAQKDMLMDTLGGVSTLVLFYFLSLKQSISGVTKRD
jgi:putative membrane protein